MSRRGVAVAIVPVAVVAAAVGVAVAHRGHPAIVMSSSIPQLLQRGERVVVNGRAVGAPRRSRIRLEDRGGTGWSSLATARPGRGGRFVLVWTVPAAEPAGPFPLRIAITTGRRTLAHTRTTHSTVAQPSGGCVAATPPPRLPAGDGWLTGGEYFEGGAYPGTRRCSQQPYTVTARNTSGSVAATQQVAGGHSFSFVVPAGSYTLSAGPCRTAATVTAGRQTQADVTCQVP